MVCLVLGFFLSLKCRCYLFKRGKWQAISLVNLPTLCKPSCCLIIPGNLLHNQHSQKRSQGHANLVICLWWNFNQHTMKSLFGAITLTWFLTEVSAKFPPEIRTRLIQPPSYRPTYVDLMSPPHPSQPHNPASYRLYHAGGETDAGLCGFDALPYSKEELIARGRSGCIRDTALHTGLQVLRLSSSPWKSCLFLPWPVQVQFGLCSFLILHGMILLRASPHTGVHPKGSPTAALLPQAFGLLSLALAFVLGGAGKTCPTANRNGRPQSNLSFITRSNPIYSWT